MDIQSKKLLLDCKLPYGTVVYHSNGATGSVSIDIPYTQDYFVKLIGGGGGGMSLYVYYSNGQYQKHLAGGGSGGMVSGVIRIEKGTYTATIGSGGNGNYYSGYQNTSYHYSYAGTNTVFNGITAKAGGRAGCRSHTSAWRIPGTGGSGNVGNFTTLVIKTGATGGSNGGSNKKPTTVSHTAGVDGNSYGRGGGATDGTGYAGYQGLLYIEAR